MLHRKKQSSIRRATECPAIGKHPLPGGDGLLKENAVRRRFSQDGVVSDSNSVMDFNCERVRKIRRQQRTVLALPGCSIGRSNLQFEELVNVVLSESIRSLESL